MLNDEIMESAYLAWLASARIPADSLLKLLDMYNSGESVYRAVRSGNPQIQETVPPGALTTLRRNAAPDTIRMFSERISSHQIRAMTIHDPKFPCILRDIEDPVSILFYQGNTACLTGRIIGMVGSRQASYAGLKAAQRIARDLSREGVSVISGFAYGIDSASHRGCIEGGSPTIAVMGCGLDIDYPADNAELRRTALEGNGLFLSEYAPGEKPLAGNFPYRNRIISALGAALILMEAKIRSGSLRTVDHALKQGKDIFVYPGDPESLHFEGNHQLLRDGGRYFTTARDVLEDLDWLDKKPGVVQNSGCSGSPAADSPAEERIMQILRPGALSFEQLAAKSMLTPAELLSLLTILQVRGMIEPLPGKKYQMKQ